MEREAVRRVVAAALREDVGEVGDITTAAVVPAERRAAGHVVARQELVVAGLEVAREVFRQLDPRLRFTAHCEEGARLEPGNRLLTVAGAARPILTGERTALNFLGRMCGIATAAREAVHEIEGTGARILDTRKTAPGLRILDKHAVAAGGALNHRMGLYDAVMIKDTHLAVAGSAATAVACALRAGVPRDQLTVEVRNVEELEEAIRAGAGRALLDNADRETVARAAARARGRIVLEVSGGLRPGRLREVAECGVDCLSLGWLTHSAPAADLAMDLEPLP